MQKILLLEDNPIDADLVSREIKNRWPKVELTVVGFLTDARKLMQSITSFDIALFDLKLPDGNGMELLSELRNQKCEIPIIVFTAEGSEEIAIAALQAGATDYIPKTPGFYKRIPSQIEFALQHSLTNRKQLSVLYVENNKSDIDLTSIYFKKNAPQINLTIVSSGEEALNLLPENDESLCNFDVLLLDYLLPGLNAIEISKIIRQERHLSIAIVIVTGQGNEKIAVEALKLGVDDYVVKRENYLLRLPSVLSNAFRYWELERKQKALILSEAQYRIIFEGSDDGIMQIDKNLSVLNVNLAFTEITGISKETIIGKSAITLAKKFVNIKQLPFILNHLKNLTIKNPLKYFELFYQDKILGISSNRQENGQKIAIIRDITERKQAEIKIMQALAEKEELLKEIHHRVKNNLQALLYLSEMQSEKITDLLKKETFYSLNRQIRAMSMVHDKLYQSKDLAKINFKEYLNDLAYNILDTFETSLDVQIHVKADKSLIGLNFAIPFGQIVNELIANSLKHAFPNDWSKEKEIQVEFESRKNQWILIISDNGIGIPENIDYNNTETLGLTLVKAWVTYQLGGTLELDTSKGSKFTINIPKRKK